tara:strand:- start:1650 stop:1994 length:345 start_codon:yes stop_codon:yes gene_type:complete
MAVIRSGDLRFYGRIEQDTGSSRNSVGEVTSSWSEKTTAWMNIVKLSGTELVTAQQIKANSTHKITMRYQPGITADMRIKWNPVANSTSTLHIVDVNNMEHRNYALEILAKEDS